MLYDWKGCVLRILVGIAVLVAIAIPVFTSQLEKSRDSASISNIRSAYAQAQAAVVANAYVVGTHGAITDGHATIDAAFDFGNMSGKVTVNGVDIESQAKDNWSELAGEYHKEGDLTLPEDPGKDGSGKNKSVVFTYATDANKVTTVTAAFGAAAAGGGGATGD